MAIVTTRALHFPDRLINRYGKYKDSRRLSIAGGAGVPIGWVDGNSGTCDSAQGEAENT